MDTIIETNYCTGQMDEDSAGIDSRANTTIIRYNKVVGCKGAGVRLGGHKVGNDQYGIACQVRKDRGMQEAVCWVGGWVGGCRGNAFFSGGDGGRVGRGRGDFGCLEWTLLTRGARRSSWGRIMVCRRSYYELCWRCSVWKGAVNENHCVSSDAARSWVATIEAGSRWVARS